MKKPHRYSWEDVLAIIRCDKFGVASYQSIQALFLGHEDLINWQEKRIEELEEINSIYGNIAEVDRSEETEKLIKENLKLRQLLVNTSTLEDKIELLEFEIKEINELLAR